MICCSRLTSVTIVFGSGCSMLIDEVDVLGLGEVAEAALDRALQVVEAQLADVDRDRARLDLRQVEDVVDQHQQVVARRVDRLGELDLLAGSGCLPGSCTAGPTGSAGCSAACAARATCWPGTRTCTSRSARAARPSPRAPGAPARPRWFLRSTSWFWCASRRAFSCSSWLVCCSSCWRLCSSSASDCDCFSRSSVRDVGLDRVDHDADRFGQLVEEGLVRPG